MQKGKLKYPIIFVLVGLLIGGLSADEMQDSAFVPVARTDYTKEELLSKLKTREAQLALDQARTEMDRAKLDYEQAQGLFDKKVYPIDELNKYKRSYEQAQLTFRQAGIALDKTRLDLLQNAILITLVDALKYRGEDGKVRVSVRLRNDSDVDKARIAMEDQTGGSAEKSAALLTVDNVVVSLHGLASISSDPKTPGQLVEAVVGDPYQQIVPKLKLNQEVMLQFALLQKDVENINLNLTFLGKTQVVSVFLKKEDKNDLPSITSTQFSQQGQLGSKIRYDLTLERLAKSEQSFSLLVLNLPKEFPFAFMDPVNGASVTNVKFTEQISKQSLNFELTVPEKLDQKFIDQSVEFTIMVSTQEELKKIYELRKKLGDKTIPPDELVKLSGNKAQLILIPKGSGKLDIVVPNLFKEIKKGDDLSIKISLLNSGTMEMRRITPVVDFPLEWEGTLTPQVIDIIEPGQKALLTIDVKPAHDVTIGEYTLKISASGYSGVETINAVDKNFTVRVSAESNIAGTVILVLILIGLVGGIAVASIKIARR